MEEEKIRDQDAAKKGRGREKGRSVKCSWGLKRRRRENPSKVIRKICDEESGLWGMSPKTQRAEKEKGEKEDQKARQIENERDP